MPAANGVLVGGQRDRLAFEPDLARVGPRHAEQRQGELGAPGAQQAGEAQHLAAMQGEADVLILAGAGQAAHLQQRRRRRPWSRADTVCSMVSPVISSPMRRASTSATGQVPTLRPSRITVTRSAISTTSSSRWLTKTTATPSAFSLATMRSSASTSARVSEAVGSSMNRSLASAASPRQMATTCRSAIDSEATPASSGRSKPEPCQQVARDLAHPGAPHRTGEPAQALVDGDVLGHRQVREQRQVLEDDLHAQRLGQRRVEVVAHLAGELDPAARVGRMHAGDQLDQGGLAAAVLADEAMHLAGQHVPVDPVERGHAAEALADGGEPEEWRDLLHRRGRPRGRPLAMRQRPMPTSSSMVSLLIACSFCAWMLRVAGSTLTGPRPGMSMPSVGVLPLASMLPT